MLMSYLLLAAATYCNTWQHAQGITAVLPPLLLKSLRPAAVPMVKVLPEPWQVAAAHTTIAGSYEHLHIVTQLCNAIGAW
jgi:hypothetical protein